MKYKKKKTVFVGLSGGVDSAVSAALLKQAGHEVVGVFIKTWHPEFLECHEEEERRDAMRVAAHLDIPFLTFDLEDVYKKEVADYMIAEYKAGRTPNPDVMCNKEVKFGAFLEKAVSLGALVRPSAETYVATGHYAEVLASGEAEIIFSSGDEAKQDIPEKKLFLLRRGVDSSKDQSYFLWTLNQKQLSKILFPIGGFRKTEVRKLAKKFGLPVAEKKDSQGICFLGAVDLKAFLKHYIKEKRGKVLLAPSEAGNKKGEEVGYHDGAVFHTLGERHGFTITKKSSNDSPYYIVGKDVKKNILFVSHSARKDLAGNNSDMYIIEDTNWISEIPEENKNYTAQIRYHGELFECKIKISSKSEAKVIFDKSILVAPGQSIVVYDGDVCLGGGVVV